MNYATIKYNDIANGEGVRTSLFVSGCNHHCKGCFNSEAWDFSYGSTFDDDIIKDIIKSIDNKFIKGLSLLGGEPLDPKNQVGIYRLIKAFNEKQWTNKNIWCYTGYTYEKDLLKGQKSYTKYTDYILDSIDVLVDGKFVEDLKDISLSFRGSSNQRIINLKKTRISNNIILDERYM